MKLLKALKNDRGSTLLLVVISLSFMLIITGAFQTVVMSFATRTETMHYEQQAYISARSVANTLAEEIQDYSERIIMSYTEDDRDDNGLLTGPTAAHGLSDAQLKLVSDIADLTVGGSINFTVGFEDTPGTLDAGVTNVAITCVTDGYEIAATCELNGAKSTVKAALVGGSEVITITTPGTSGGSDSDDADANVFYSDLGIGVEAGSKFFEQPLDEVKRVVGAPFYYADGSDEFRGDIQSTQEIVVYKFEETDWNKQKNGGDFTAYGDITFQSQEVNNVGINTRSTLYLLDETAIAAGDKTITADTIHIKGDNVTSYAPLYTDNLILEGENIYLGGNVYAGRIQIVKNSTSGSLGAATTASLFSTTGEVYVVDTPTLDASDPLPSGYSTVTGEFQVDFDNGSFKGNVNQLDSAGREESMVYRNRAKPLWADTTSDTNIPFDGSMMTGGMDHYYTVPSNPDRDGWDNISISNTTVESYSATTGNFSDYNPVRILVKDGQKLRVDVSAAYYDGGVNSITGDWYESGIGANFILEGNAKVLFDCNNTGAEGLFRVYGDALSTTEYNQILSEMRAIIDEYDGVSVPESTALIQNRLKGVVNSHMDNMNCIYLAEGTVLKGTYVVNYITSELDILSNPDGDIPSMRLKGKGYLDPDHNGSDAESSAPGTTIDPSVPPTITYETIVTFGANWQFVD